MPVTIRTAAHTSESWSGAKVATAHELLEKSCPLARYTSESLIQSSFSDTVSQSHISASHHGFVYAVIQAYTGHHNLIIRPEDVWFSILIQLRLFLHRYGQHPQSCFVSTSGQRELEIATREPLTARDIGRLALQLTRLVEEDMEEMGLREWVIPEFTTTKESDQMVAAILMLGGLQRHFSYQMSFRCGIPSVTLLGERKDWANIVRKLDNIYQLGDEPARFVQLLRPVLNHFVLAFDCPESPEVRNFWNNCARGAAGSGSPWITGWVSVFCFWNEESKLVFPETINPVYSSAFKARNTDLGLEDSLARRVDSSNLPSGYAAVGVTLNNNGEIHRTMMIAGVVGIQATSEPDGSDGVFGQRVSGLFEIYRWGEALIRDRYRGERLDFIQPVSGWWMYERFGASRKNRRRHRRRRSSRPGVIDPSQ